MQPEGLYFQLQVPINGLANYFLFKITTVDAFLREILTVNFLTF